MKKEVVIGGIIYVPEGSKRTERVKPNPKGMEFCIIRTYSAGVFAGWINRKKKGESRTIYDARRLWYWKTTGLDVSTIAEIGVISEECKFSEIRKEIDLENVIEVQPCTEKAKKTIEKVKVYSNGKRWLWGLLWLWLWLWLWVWLWLWLW